MTKPAAIGVGVGVVLCSLAACGSHRSGGSPPSRASVGLLATVPDTAANRRNIVEDDPSWLADAALMRRQWCDPGGSSSAQRDALYSAVPDGSPLGSQLVDSPFLGTRPLGYRPAAATEELTVGDLPDQLTVVRVPVPKSTEPDLERIGYHPQAAVGGHPTLRSRGLNLRHVTQLGTTLMYIRTIELGPALIAGGGDAVKPAALSAVLDDRQAKDPLSSDPDVEAVTSALDAGGSTTDSPVEVLGRELLASPLGVAAGKQLTPEQTANLVHRFGLNRLQIPASYAGYRYVTSSHPACTVVTATLYPTAGAAKTAAEVLGPVLRHGTSLSANVRYDTLWTVKSLTVHGRAVVARLDLRKPYAINQTLERFDFPLFWQPMVAKS